MNRFSIVALVCSVAILVVSSILFFKKEKIVYVDSIRLVANYNGAKVMKAEFDVKAAQWKSHLDTLALEFKTELDQYEKTAKAMNERQRQQVEQKLDGMKKQYEEYQQAVNNNYQSEDQRITSQVLKEITAFLKKYGDDHGYDFIMGATTMGNIVYANSDADITDEVLEQLNSRKVAP
ncbi:MAG: OmpH family outer membrane protein [Bacteroidota bacterium]